MDTIEQTRRDDAKRAARAIGAIFFSIFGGAWIGYWSARTFSGSIAVPAAVAVLTAAIFMLAVSQYRRFKSALEAEKNSPARQRVGRLFNIVNAAQWVVIVVGVNVLANIGLRDWGIPFAILVIGLHFLPLAHIFSNPPHYVTGGAMMLVAVSYPFLLPGGPSDPVGALGAGLILWGSALWAIRPPFGKPVSVDAVPQ